MRRYPVVVPNSDNNLSVFIGSSLPRHSKLQHFIPARLLLPLCCCCPFLFMTYSHLHLDIITTRLVQSLQQKA